MKTLTFKPFSALLTIILLLSACAAPVENLNKDEKKLYEINAETAQQVLELSKSLKSNQNTASGYSASLALAKKATITLDRNMKTLNSLTLPDETVQISQNSLVIMQSTKKIVDKVKELTNKGENLDEDEIKSLLGYADRLAQSNQKLVNYNDQLLKDAANRPSSTNTTAPAPTTN
ncbi:hypothetical protein KKH03_00655 [Patescibacteria group bacterium]|nr:hypothetical protein [Patescibacteria group bacterium]